MGCLPKNVKFLHFLYLLSEHALDQTTLWEKWSISQVIAAQLRASLDQEDNRARGDVSAEIVYLAN